MNQDMQKEINDDIIQHLGLQNLSEEKQNEVLAKIGEIILKKIFIATVHTLTDEDKKEFEQMLKRETNANEVETFLKTKIKDYPTLIQKVVEEVKSQLPRA